MLTFFTGTFISPVDSSIPGTIMRTHKISWKTITLQQKKILILVLSIVSLLLVFLDKGEVKKYAESSSVREDKFGQNTEVNCYYYCFSHMGII